jgi:hypothetical protein
MTDWTRPNLIRLLLKKNRRLHRLILAGRRRTNRLIRPRPLKNLGLRLPMTQFARLPRRSNLVLLIRKPSSVLPRRSRNPVLRRPNLHHRDLNLLSRPNWRSQMTRRNLTMSRPRRREIARRAVPRLRLRPRLRPGFLQIHPRSWKGRFLCPVTCLPLALPRLGHPLGMGCSSNTRPARPGARGFSRCPIVSVEA